MSACDFSLPDLGIPLPPLSIDLGSLGLPEITLPKFAGIDLDISLPTLGIPLPPLVIDLGSLGLPGVTLPTFPGLDLDIGLPPFGIPGFGLPDLLSLPEFELPPCPLD